MNIFKKKLIIYLLPAVAFLLWPSIRAEAQTASPGGVGLSKVELWLKADATITETNTVPRKVTRWEDKSGKERHYGKVHSRITIADGNLPTYNQSSYLMNFWPSIDFRNFGRLAGPCVVPTTDASRSSYYVFYVAEQDAGQASGHGIVYALTTAQSSSIYNFVGLNAGRPFLNVGKGSNDRTHQGNGKRYGVSVAEFMNSSTVRSSIYLNGIINNNLFALDNNSINQTPSNMGGFIGSASNKDNEGPFKGNVQEIIVLSGEQGTELPYRDLQRINSYLALKYGIGLENGNYVNSGERVIWDRTTNSGYNRNIFGLGRDDNSGLLVKQATSYGVPSLLTAYVGDLATLNSQNTSTLLNNNVFVLFGSNGETGREKYQARIGGLPLPTFFEYRLKEAYKVQLTGTTSITLNLKLNKAATTYLVDQILVSSRPDFDPAETEVYDCSKSDVVSVTLKDGNYISFAEKQSPPSADELKGLTVKIYANAEDDPNVANLGHGVQVGSWINGLIKQGNSAWEANSEGSNANKPTMNKQKDLMNFRPSIHFEANQYLFTPIYSNLDPPGTYLPLSRDSMYYLFYVSQSSNLTGGKTVIYHRDNYFGWKNGAPAYNTKGGNNNLDASTVQAYQLSDPSKKGFGITGLVHPNTERILPTLYFNGEWQQMPSSTLSNQKTKLDVGGSSSNFTGDIQEMAVFATPNTNGAKPLSIGVLRIINSTLAVKYGVTLTEGDYVLPDTLLPVPILGFQGSLGQTAVWSRSKAVDAKGQKYEQSIFGIGRSAAIKGLSVMSILGIHQKQARAHTLNNPYGSPLAVYVGNELKTLNSDNTGSLPEGVFLMFSADEELTVETRGLDDVYPENTEFENGKVISEDVDARSAVFKAQLTASPLNPISSLTVRFKNMLNLRTNSYLVVSQSPEFVPTATSLYPFKSDNTTEDVVIKDGDYLTIITSSVYGRGPGGIAGDLRFWLRAEKNFLNVGSNNTVSSWETAGESEVKLVYGIPSKGKDNVTRLLPIFKEFDPKSNYHPAVVFNEGVDNAERSAILASPTGMMSKDAPDVFTFFTVLANDFSYNTEEDKGIRAYPIGFGDYDGNKLDDPGTSDAINRRPAFGIESNTNKTAGKGRIVDI